MEEVERMAEVSHSSPTARTSQKGVFLFENRGFGKRKRQLHCTTHREEYSANKLVISHVQLHITAKRQRLRALSLRPSPPPPPPLLLSFLFPAFAFPFTRFHFSFLFFFQEVFTECLVYASDRMMNKTNITLTFKELTFWQTRLSK